MSLRTIARALGAQLTEAGWSNVTASHHGTMITLVGDGPDGKNRSGSGVNGPAIVAELIAIAALPQDEEQS